MTFCQKIISVCDFGHSTASFFYRMVLWPKNLVLDHSTEKSFHRKLLTERPFDRNTIWPNTVWPNAIWPKVYSPESPFNRTPFDRKFILPIFFLFQKMVIWTNLLLTKNVIWPKKNCAQGRWTENTFDREFLWPKALSENDHLTERSFDQKFIWPKAFFKKYSFDRIFFLKNCHLTDLPYSIRIVYVPNRLEPGAFLYGKISNSKIEESCKLKSCGHS
jgi:hypothetical protein